METAERLKIIISYIEKHITEDIDLNHLANITYCSVYNLQHMFAFVTGISIAEYIRKRRLTLAGIDIQQNNMKIIDAAIKYSYNSSVSFARAFKAFHGVKASEAKKAGVVLKEFSRISFQIYMKEFIEMEIIEKKEVILVGCYGKNAGETWGRWERLTETQIINHGINDDKGHSAGYEVHFYPHDGEQVFVGVEVTRVDSDSAWEHLRVPRATCAVFDIDQKIDQGPQFNSINEWIEENKNIYKRFVWDANGKVDMSEFVVCVYDHREMGKYAREQVMEMWIPLVKQEL